VLVRGSSIWEGGSLRHLGTEVPRWSPEAEVLYRMLWSEVGDPQIILEKLAQLFRQKNPLGTPQLSDIIQSTHYGFNHLIYTVSQKKQDTQLTLAHNFTKYWPIFKILSLLDSVGNL